MVTIRTPLRVLGQDGANGGLQAGVDPSVGSIASIAQANADGRLGQQGEGEVTHVAGRVLQVWAIREPRQGRGGELVHTGWRTAGGTAARGDTLIEVQGIGEQVEVEEVVIAPVEGDKIVPLVLLHPQASHVFRVAAESEAAYVEVVEKQTLVADGLHGQLLVQKPWTTLQVDEGGVHLLIALGLGDVAAPFHGLAHGVVAPHPALVFIGLGQDEQGQREHQDGDKECMLPFIRRLPSNGLSPRRRSRGEVGFGFAIVLLLLYLKKRSLTFEPWILLWQTMQACRYWNWAP